MQALSVVVARCLIPLRFVVAVDTVISRGRTAVSDAVVQHWCFSVPWCLRHPRFRTFPFRFAPCIRRDFSFQRYVVCQASSLWPFIDITSLAFASLALAPVPHSAVFHAPPSWLVINLSSFDLALGPVASVQLLEFAMHHHHGHAIDISFAYVTYYVISKFGRICVIESTLLTQERGFIFFH